MAKSLYVPAISAEIERRFGITVRPAPDFVMFDAGEMARAMLECKHTRDALGPVVEHTDGRVYSLANLPDILETDPMPSLIGVR